MFPVSDVIPSRTRPVVTASLIGISSIVFLYQLRLDPAEMFDAAHRYGVAPASFSWVQLLTSPFMHDGWIHFGGNMLYLWIFGDNVEDAIGHAGYLLFYFAAAAVAALAHATLHPLSPVPLVGASGAVAAVMGAYFVLYPRSQVLTAIFLVLYLDLVEIPAVIFLGVWLLIQLFSGLTSRGAQAVDGGVAFGAHIAGFAVGLVAGVVLRRRQRQWE